MAASKKTSKIPDSKTSRSSGSPSAKSTSSKSSMERFKTEVASELGVNLKNGHNGNITSREPGSIGADMVRRMINKQRSHME